jgi:hypothetical protein
MNWHKVPLTIWSKSSHSFQQVVFHAASFFDLDSEGRSRFLREKVDVLRSRVPVWRGMMMDRIGRSQGPASDSVTLGRVWEANDLACWKYVPKPYNGVVVDFRPARQYSVFKKPDLKWDQLALAGQRVVVLPVNPAAMLLEPFVKHLASAVRELMDEVIAIWE